MKPLPTCPKKLAIIWDNFKFKRMIKSNFDHSDKDFLTILERESIIDIILRKTAKKRI